MGRSGTVGRRSAIDGQPPPSQQPSIFWRQSRHHHAERIQKSTCSRPVIAQITGPSSRGERTLVPGAGDGSWEEVAGVTWSDSRRCSPSGQWSPEPARDPNHRLRRRRGACPAASPRPCVGRPRAARSRARRVPVPRRARGTRASGSGLRRGSAWRRVLASRSAAPSASSAGTVSWTRPIAAASSAPIVRPVKISSLARATPTNGVSLAGPTGTPSRAPAHASCRLSPAMRRSQPATISAPPPTQLPTQTAIVGSGNASSAVRKRENDCIRAMPPAWSSSSVTSTPEQSARADVVERITTRSSSSTDRRSSASTRSDSSAESSALRRSGRSRRSTAIPAVPTRCWSDPTPS